MFENVYKVIMKLTIVSLDHSDFGAYKCVAKNSLGETDGSIKLYSKYTFYIIIYICSESIAMLEMAFLTKTYWILYSSLNVVDDIHGLTLEKLHK